MISGEICLQVNYVIGEKCGNSFKDFSTWQIECVNPAGQWLPDEMIVQTLPHTRKQIKHQGYFVI